MGVKQETGAAIIELLWHTFFLVTIKVLFTSMNKLCCFFRQRMLGNALFRFRLFSCLTVTTSNTSVYANKTGCTPNVHLVYQ